MKIKQSLYRFCLLAMALTIGSRAMLASPSVVMKILIVGTSNNDISYQSIAAYMTQLGVPYQSVLLNNVTPDSSGNRLSGVSFSDAGTGNGSYQGIILTDSSFNVCTTTCKSLLSDADWSRLKTYASQYAVRTIIYNGWPEPQWGLQPGDSGASYKAANPLLVNLTAAGASIFSYLNAANPIAISGQGDTGIWAYRALPTAAANETTTPVLTAGSNVVAVTHTTADGREVLTMAMDNYPTLLHSMAFSYGVINWVTKGVFLSSRRVYLYPQIDDLLLGNRLYAPTRPECPNDQSCPTIFATAEDLNAIANWQAGLQADPQFQTFHNTFAYNGVGTTWFPASDPIFAAISSLSSRFTWLSHTWDHANLDCYALNNGSCVPATLAQSRSELNQNINVAPSLGITLNRTDMVTPFNGGLENPSFVQAAVEAGLQNIVFAGRPSSPNTGIVNSYNAAIFEIPRPVPDLFDNVSSPQTGVYGSWPDEYNAKYGPSGSNPIYAQNLTYNQILDIESDKIFKESMLAYEPYPLAFHIDNMSLYDGTHSMYMDLMNMAIAKYKKLFSLPALTLDMKDVTPILRTRASYNASGVVGVYTPGVSVVLTTVKAATIPVTGACSQAACATYGGQLQDNVTMAANSSVTLSLNAVEGVTPSSISFNPASVNGGAPSTGTLTLSSPAPAGGISLTLSSDSSAVSVPGVVTVSAGSSSSTFTATTSAVGSTVTALIAAGYNGVSKTATLTVKPTAGVSSLVLNPTSVVGGNVSTGTVTLTSAAPTGGVVVTLSSNTASATVPASVTIAAGSSNASFSVTTKVVTASTPATITASYNSTSKAATLTMMPSVQAVALSSVALNPASVAGGKSSTGTVTLTSAAPAGGISVSLLSNSGSATVPASVTVAAGSSSATFAVATKAAAASSSVTISATYSSVTKTASLSVTATPVSLSSVTVSPASVKGGTSATGTVTLNLPAPSGGATVSLRTSNTLYSGVPASVTVAAGSSTGTFAVTTARTTIFSRSVTITATYSGATTTAKLTITP